MQKLFWATDLIGDPTPLDTFAARYFLLVDQSLSESFNNLLTAIEQLEPLGWDVVSITATYAPPGHLLYALMRWRDDKSDQDDQNAQVEQDRGE